LWAKQQLKFLAQNYLDLAHFCEYLKENWLHKARMWCVKNQNIPHAGQYMNATMESFHNNMKQILDFSQKRLTKCMMD
jgi:hypothetical protein